MSLPSSDRRLVRQAVDRRFVGADGVAGESLGTFARGLGVLDPVGVEAVGAGGQALVAFARVQHAGVAAVQQHEEVVLRLAVAAKVADQALAERRALDAHFFFAALAQRRPSKPISAEWPK